MQEKEVSQSKFQHHSSTSYSAVPHNCSTWRINDMLLKEISSTSCNDRNLKKPIFLRTIKHPQTIKSGNCGYEEDDFTLITVCRGGRHHYCPTPHSVNTTTAAMLALRSSPLNRWFSFTHTLSAPCPKNIPPTFRSLTQPNQTPREEKNGSMCAVRWWRCYTVAGRTQLAKPVQTCPCVRIVWNIRETSRNTTLLYRCKGHWTHYPGGLLGRIVSTFPVHCTSCLLISNWLLWNLVSITFSGATVSPGPVGPRRAASSTNFSTQITARILAEPPN